MDQIRHAAAGHYEQAGRLASHGAFSFREDCFRLVMPGPPVRCGFQHRMHAAALGGHGPCAGPARPVDAIMQPELGLPRQVKNRAVPQPIGRFGIMGKGRDDVVVEAQCGFYQRRQAGRSTGMSQIGLGRPDGYRRGRGLRPIPKKPQRASASMSSAAGRPLPWVSTKPMDRGKTPASVKLRSSERR